MKKRWLVVRPGKAGQEEIVLSKQTYQIGRGTDCAIRLPSKNVSGTHASLVIKDDTITLIDLDSTNGTFVNGKRVKKTQLHNKDKIQFADLAVVYREQAVSAEYQSSRQRTETCFPRLENAKGTRIYQFLQQLSATGIIEQRELQELAGEWESLQQSARRLDGLYGLLEDVLGITDRRELIVAVLGKVCSLVGLDVVGLYLREEDTFYVLEQDRLITEKKTETLSASVLEKVLSTGGPVVLENIGADSGVVGFESLMEFRIQSVLCFPVQRQDGEVVGALYCISRETAELKVLEQDKPFLKACSSFVAMSLDNVSLIEQQRRQAHSQERNRQEQRFSPVINRLQQEKENLSLKLREVQKGGVFGLDSPANGDLAAFVAKAAKTDLPVLIMGETGVGKSLLAEHIHRVGLSGKPFVTIDCTTIPAELLESELFGHEKGAFTGAHAKKGGKVAQAKDGTLFIDEIADLSPKLQGKLLRLIQSGQYETVGGTQTIRSKARLVCASNRDLRKEVRDGRFREDLFFRLNILSFTIRPLREIPELILPLARHFLANYAAKINPSVRVLTTRAEHVLMAHGWPGNIRELENAVMRGLVSAENNAIDAEDLGVAEHSTQLPDQREHKDEGGGEGESLDLKQARERVDRTYITKALSLAGHNVSQAARILNISRNSLMDLIKKYGL